MGSGPMELIAKARSGRAEALGELCVALSQLHADGRPHRASGPSSASGSSCPTWSRRRSSRSSGSSRSSPGRTRRRWSGWLRRLVGQKLADLGRYHSPGEALGGAPDVPLDAAIDAGGAADAGGGGGGKLLDMLALSQTSPSEAASRRELTVLLADAVAGLPEQEAEVLWLYHADGLSFEAIGDRLGVSRKSVRGIYARGLRDLKRTFDGHSGEQGEPEAHEGGRETSLETRRIDPRIRVLSSALRTPTVRSRAKRR